MNGVNESRSGNRLGREEIERQKVQKLELAGRNRIEVILARYRSRGSRG